MTFTCQQCGECCCMMGEVIEIREETGPRCYRIGYTTTGEERQVAIDPDKADLFSGRTATAKRSPACPFLREVSPGRTLCTIHASRPDLCRHYSCFRVLVLDPEGNRIGKVREHSRILMTMDHPLREVWDRDISRIDNPDERCWEECVEQVLSRKGYRVIH